MSPQFWLNLQTNYDLEIESDKLKKELRLEVKILSAEAMTRSQLIELNRDQVSEELLAKAESAKKTSQKELLDI